MFPAGWPFCAHQRSLTYAHAPVSSVRAIPTGASWDSSRTRASLAASAALACSSSVTSRAKLQKYVWPPTTSGSRVSSTVRSVPSARRTGRRIRAANSPGSWVRRNSVVASTNAARLRSGTSTSSRRRPRVCALLRPCSSSAAWLNATIRRASSAITTASGAALISASVTARRSAISRLSSTRRIREAITVASARAVACDSAVHWPRCPTRIRAHGGEAPGSRATAISTAS